jgi:hypothetical protein
MISLPHPFCTLQCHELDSNSKEFAFDVITWFDHPTNGKKYGCVDEAGRELFKQSERCRGKCDFYRKHDRPGDSHSSNETWICNRSRDSHRGRRAKQQLGHAAAANNVQLKRKNQKQWKKEVAASVSANPGVGVSGAPGSAHTSTSAADASASAALCNSLSATARASHIQRLGKNSTGEALTCAECRYQMQLIAFKANTSKLFIVLAYCGHTNDNGNVCHGPGSGAAPVRQKADADIREFIRSQYQAGVPPARIQQGIGIDHQTRCCTCVPCQCIIMCDAILSVLQTVSQSLLPNMA